MRTIQNFGKNKYKSKPKTEVRPTYFRKTFSSDRTGKIVIPSNSEGKVVFRTKNEDSVRINGKKPEASQKIQSLSLIRYCQAELTISNTNFKRKI